MSGERVRNCLVFGKTEEGGEQTTIMLEIYLKDTSSKLELKKTDAGGYAIQELSWIDTF